MDLVLGNKHADLSGKIIYSSKLKEICTLKEL
jgi:hypothetical protein